MKRMMVVLGLLLSALITPAARAQVGAFETDCRVSGEHGDGGHQFVATCPGRAVSPDGRLAVVQKAYDEEQPPIELQDASGKTLATLPSLSDDMPFLVSWSPDSRWFYVNHHVGSFMDSLQVFEIVGGVAVERHALVRSAIRAATRRYPCLRQAMVNPNGARWTRDGHGIVIVTISRPSACQPPDGPSGKWEPLWMIGEVESGRIDPASIRVETRQGSLKAPTDGVYATR